MIFWKYMTVFMFGWKTDCFVISLNLFFNKNMLLKNFNILLMDY